MKQKCSEKVWHGAGMTIGCVYNGVVQEDGKPWCRHHAPSARRAKKAARDARREAKWAAQDAAGARQDRIKAAEAKVVEAAVDLYEDQISRSELDDAIYELLNAREAVK